MYDAYINVRPIRDTRGFIQYVFITHIEIKEDKEVVANLQILDIMLRMTRKVCPLESDSISALKHQLRVMPHNLHNPAYSIYDNLIAQIYQAEMMATNQVFINLYYLLSNTSFG